MKVTILAPRAQARALRAFVQAWEPTLTPREVASLVVRARRAARGSEWFAKLTLPAPSRKPEPGSSEK